MPKPLLFAMVLAGFLPNLLANHPAIARIAPGKDGVCPSELNLDRRSGRCLPPGKSLPALGATDDPSSSSKKVVPVKESAQPQKPGDINENEALEVCARYPGTQPKATPGGYLCVPVR